MKGRSSKRGGFPHQLQEYLDEVSLRGANISAAELGHHPIRKSSYRRSLSACARVDQAVTDVADIVGASGQWSDQAPARQFAFGQKR